jgi:hypothetical protein
MVLAFSIPDFCEEHGICRATLYNLLRAGLGPATMKVGTRTLISAESAAEWRRASEVQIQSRPPRPKGSRVVTAPGVSSPCTNSPDARRSP